MLEVDGVHEEVVDGSAIVGCEACVDLTTNLEILGCHVGCGGLMWLLLALAVLDLQISVVVSRCSVRSLFLFEEFCVQSGH